MEERASPLELFFDVVFVFALTQITALLADDLSAAAFVRDMLLLALIWWGWICYAWVTNVHSMDETLVRGAMVVALVACFFMALTIPEAFGEQGTTFAVANLVFRATQIALFVLSAAREEHSRPAAPVIAVAFGAAALIVLGGSFLDGDARMVVWALALAVDVAGPILFRSRINRLEIGHAHFAERFGLFIIVCLGEAVVATGIGAEKVELDLVTGVRIVLALLLAVSVWWTYFDFVAPAAEERLGEAGDERTALARDAYSYLHFVMVAGIVILAVGLKYTVGGKDPGWTIGAGMALYLAGHVLFRLRMIETISRERVTAAIACLGAIALGGRPALAAGLVVAVMTALIVVEAFSERDARDRAKQPAEASA